MSCRTSLHAILDAHRAAGALEARHRQRMLELCGVGGDPFARDHFEPGHFTASGFVLSPARDALVLIHHRKLDRWLQPGGHLEPGDADVVAAARREVLEETGLSDLEQQGTGAFDLDVHAIPQLGAEPPHEHFDVRFLFVAGSRALRLSAESKAVRWVPLSEIGVIGGAASVESDESVMRVVRKVLQG